MNGFLIFLSGVLAGGALGIATMCLMQINRINDEEDKDR